MAKKQNEARKTSAKMVMDVFHRRNAYSPETAISIDQFKNLQLTTAIISYTIGNFVNDGIVVETGDERFYFDQKAWEKMKKKVSKAYWILYGSPAILLVIILVITHWNDLSKIFFK